MAAEAVFRIRVEGGSEVKRALNDSVGRSRQASQAQNAEARRAAKEQERIARQVARAQERAAIEARKAVERERKAAERAEQRAIAQAARAAAKAAKDAQSAEAAKTKAAEREAKQRQRIAEREAREQRRLAERGERDHARAEKQKTAASEREARRRANADAQAARQAARSRANRGRAIGEQAAGAVGAFGSNVHGMIQGAREQRAATETILNDAIVQGMTRQDQRGALSALEAASLRQRVFTFARDRGIREEDIAPALEHAQSRFSLISGATDASGQNTASARRESLDQFLQVADLARTTGNNIGDTTAFFGALRHMGMSAEDAQVSTRQATAAGFAGSVSLGEASSQGLAALRQSVANATAGLSGEARQAAIREQVSRFFANLQLQAAVGARVGVSGNRLTGLEALFDNDASMAVVGNRLTEHFTRTGNRASRDQARAMFNVDERTGNLTSLREEFRDPTRFASAMTNLFGGDVSQFRNVMGAHGSWSAAAGGKNRAINTPLVAGLANVMSLGSDALAKRDEIMGARLSDQDLQAMRDVRATEETTSLVRAQQENRDALTTNSGELGKLSKAFAEWAARNPIAEAAGSAVGSGIAGVVAGRLGAAAAGTGAAGSLVAAGGTAVGAASALAVGGTALVGGILGGAAGEGMRALVDSIAEPDASAERRAYLARNREETSAFSMSGWRLLAKEISDAIRGGAEVRQGAAFNRANAATGTNSVPPEHRSRG